MGKNYVDIENERGETLRYRKHVNGRGLIANGARFTRAPSSKRARMSSPVFRSPQAPTWAVACGSSRTP